MSGLGSENVVPLAKLVDTRFDSPVAHLYPLISKDWPPPARLENAVRVFYRDRWHLATLLTARSGPKGCMVVLMGEREMVRDDKKGTPIARYFDWTEVKEA